MYIAGLVFDGLLQDNVDETHDGGVVGRLLQLGLVGIGQVLFLMQAFDLLEHIVDGTALFRVE